MLELLGPSTGGIRRHVTYLSESLQGRGWEVAVAGPPGVVAPASIAVHAVAVPRRPDPVRLWRARRQLAHLVDGVDLLHAHGLKAGWLAISLTRRPPVVLTVHNIVLDEVEGRRAPFLRVFESALAGRVDSLIAVSDEIAGRFAGVGAPVTAIPPAGPPPRPDRRPDVVRRELGIAPEGPLVAAVARLHRQKDLPTLLRALVIARQELPALQAVIVGDGPEKAPLHALAGTLGLTGPAPGAPPVLRFVDSHPNTASVMAAADVVVVSSCWESGPLVLAEAMLLARPVITTPVGFAPRLVSEGKTGRLTPVGDHAAMARAMLEVLRDPADAARLGNAAHAVAAGAFGDDAVVAPVEAVYRATLSA